MELRNTVAFAARSGREDLSSFWDPTDRFVCVSGDSSALPLHDTGLQRSTGLQQSPSICSRRNESAVEFASNFCLSATNVGPISTKQVRGTRSRMQLIAPVWNNTHLASDSDSAGHALQHSPEVTISNGSDSQHGNGAPSSESGSATTDDMAVMRQSTAQFKFQAAALCTFEHSWRKKHMQAVPVSMEALVFLVFQQAFGPIYRFCKEIGGLFTVLVR